MNIATAMSIVSLGAYGMVSMRAMLIPFASLLLLAMILYPIYKQLLHWGTGRTGAIGICLLLTIVLFAVLIISINRQIVAFIKDLLQGW